MIGKGVFIGEGASIMQNVTIGEARVDSDRDGLYPVIGKNVYIGAGSCLLGGISIQDRVRIGALTLVTIDCPSGCTIVGNNRIIDKD